MTHRERVLAAVSHQAPDRVPRDYWATDEVTARLVTHLGLPDTEALLRRYGFDLRYVEGPAFVGQDLHQYEDGSVEDLWGVRRLSKTVTRGGYEWTYKHVVQAPLARAQSVQDIEGYSRWPSADWWDYSGVANQCLAHAGYAVVNAGDRLDRTAQLKPMMYLRGMEQTYVDLAVDQDIAQAIIRHIVEYFLQYNQRVLEAARVDGVRESGSRDAQSLATSDLRRSDPRGDSAIDIFMMGDDFGTQQGPMMSLETWRRFFRPGFSAYTELAHRYGLKVMHHTCGSVADLIPDFIDCGLDILQSLQPQAAGMDLGALRHRFGRHLCFHGGLDIQGVLPHGTPQQVKDHVRRQIAAAGDQGGYILCTAHNLQPDTPTDNLLALFEAYEEYGG